MFLALLICSFRAGIDGRGVFTEFFMSLCKEVFDIDRGLSLENKKNELYPNPRSYAPECKLLFAFYLLHFSGSPHTFSSQPELALLRWPNTWKSHVWGYPSWRCLCWILSWQGSFVLMVWIWSSTHRTLVAWETKHLRRSRLSGPEALPLSYRPEELPRKLWIPLCLNFTAELQGLSSL